MLPLEAAHTPSKIFQCNQCRKWLDKNIRTKEFKKSTETAALIPISKSIMKKQCICRFLGIFRLLARIECVVRGASNFAQLLTIHRCNFCTLLQSAVTFFEKKFLVQ